MKKSSRILLLAFCTIALAIGQGTLVEISSAKNTEKQTKPVSKVKNVAHIRLAGKIENSPADFSFFGKKNLTVKDWLHRFARVRKDKSIAGVIIEVESPGCGLSTASELAAGIREIAKVKPVYAHIISGGISQYILASAGTETWLEPAGGLNIVGIGGELTFYRGMMDKFGLKPQFIQIGKYKGASEPYMRTKPSKALLAEYNALFDGLYDHLASEIGTNRDMNSSMVKAIIDQGPFTGKSAKNLNLVDKLVTKGEVIANVRKIFGQDCKIIRNYGRPKEKKIDFSNPFAAMGALFGKTTSKRILPNTIAIIHADGPIMSGKGGSSLFGSKIVGDVTMAQAFSEAQKNDNVKAVVFRISSPGGSALASEIIYQAVKRCAAVKPVIVSIAGMGASGGYYIACGGHEIWADPSAIVGSIGVVSGRVSYQKVMKDLGITSYEITRGKNAGLFMSRPWTKDEIEIMRKHAASVYDLFLKRVTDARGKKIKDIHKVAQGRIFTGSVALKKGLVDHLGGLADVVAAAKKRANVKGKVNYLVLPRSKTFADMIQDGEENTAFNKASAELLGIKNSLPFQLLKKTGKLQGVCYLLELADMLNQERVMLALPHHIKIK